MRITILMLEDRQSDDNGNWRYLQCLSCFQSSYTPRLLWLLTADKQAFQPHVRSMMLSSHHDMIDVTEWSSMGQQTSATTHTHKLSYLCARLSNPQTMQLDYMPVYWHYGKQVRLTRFQSILLNSHTPDTIHWCTAKQHHYHYKSAKLYLRQHWFSNASYSKPFIALKIAITGDSLVVLLALHQA